MVYIPELKPLGSITTVDDSHRNYKVHVNEEIELEPGVRVRLNVFFPRSGGPEWPVLMSTTPYGKDIFYPKTDAYAAVGKDLPEETTNVKQLPWEAPSANIWCPLGYVLVVVDHRGTGQSPGYFRIMSDQQLDDYAKSISWVNSQSWCNGKIGLTGISYLGVNQWGTAARQPPGLACIAPWEAFSDYYHSGARHGGILYNGLWERWTERQIKRILYGSRDRAAGGWGRDSPEGVLTDEQIEENYDHVIEIVRKNEWRDDEFYEDRFTKADYSTIEVPILSAANWGGIKLHLHGNVLGYMRATGSKHKFLRFHTGRHDLPYYIEPYIDMQKSFFASFLKDDDYGGWQSGKQAPVSFAVRRGTRTPNVLEEELKYKYRDEQEWPIARTKYEKRYLGADRTMGSEKSGAEGKLSYKGLTGDAIHFSTPPAEKEYEVTGHPSVHLCMSLTDHAGLAPADIDVFAALRKINAEGKESLYTGSTGEPCPVTFGWIRASHRTLTKDYYPELKEELPFPVLSHLKTDRKEVKNGEVLELDFELWPTNVVVEKGERLVLEVSPKDPVGTSWFGCSDPVDRNEEKLGGTNNIHFGGEHENYVIFPIV